MGLYRIKIDLGALHLDFVADIEALQATSQRLILGGPDDMADHTITVDTTNETATVQYVDDHGDVLSAAPEGSTVAFASSDSAVATIAPDAANPLQGDITPVAVGTVTFSVSTTGADGNPLFADATSDSLTVNPGAAVGQRLTLGPA